MCMQHVGTDRSEELSRKFLLDTRIIPYFVLSQFDKNRKCYPYHHQLQFQKTTIFLASTMICSVG